MPRSAGDLMLAAVLALLSYAPFEYVAKATLLTAAALFILDPLPPYSRLVALVSMGAVGLLHRMLQSWQQGQDDEGGDMSMDTARHEEEESTLATTI